ncbi:MAG TPA: hypothetical protein VKE88_03010, partial [Candidatus Nanoarchaeia archaeon]|nr:hypothetical protein [Candidatus Nanoarchaeia archaeon]
SVNMRIIAPMLDWFENSFSLPLLPNLATTAMFIVWATFSIYLYEKIINYFLTKYNDNLTIILGVVFIGISLAVNMKYRD